MHRWGRFRGGTDGSRGGTDTGLGAVTGWNESRHGADTGMKLIQAGNNGPLDSTLVTNILNKNTEP